MTATEPRMITLPANAGEIAIRRGVNNPPRHLDPQTPTDSWAPIDLTDPQYAQPLAPPEIAGLLYAGYRHVISGPPESAKTLIAYALLLEAIRNNHHVAVIDFEMGPNGARRLLDDLGATFNELSTITFLAPHDPPDGHLHAIADRNITYVLIDAAIGAYDLSGLDDNSRKDAETFARTWIRPLWQAGIATLLIDHVTKNADTRGKFTIGSERKIGQTDVHLSFEAVKPLTRGGNGLVKAVVHKDRGAYLQRPTAALFELSSNATDHSITYARRDPNPTDDQGHFRPTVLMEKVSRYLEQHTQPLTRGQVERDVKGKSAEWIRKALDALTDEGFVAETGGARGARMVSSERPYRTSDDPSHTTSSSSSDLVSSSSDGVISPRPTSSPSTEGTRRGDGPQTTSTSSELDEHDQAFLDGLPIDLLEQQASAHTDPTDT